MVPKYDEITLEDRTFRVGERVTISRREEAGDNEVDFFLSLGRKGPILTSQEFQDHEDGAPHIEILVEFDETCPFLNNGGWDYASNSGYYGKEKQCWWFSDMPDSQDYLFKYFSRGEQKNYRIDSSGFRTDDSLWAKGLSLL